MADRPRHLTLVPALPPERTWVGPGPLACSDCYGSGVIDDELCPLCKGRVAKPNLRLLDAYTQERK